MLAVCFSCRVSQSALSYIPLLLACVFISGAEAMATDVHAESVIEANRSLLLSWRKTVSIQMGAGQAGVDDVKMADLDGLLRGPDRAAGV